LPICCMGLNRCSPTSAAMSTARRSRKASWCTATSASWPSATWITATCEVVEADGRRDRHSVILIEDYLSCEAANRPGNGSHDNFVEVLEHRLASKDEDRSPLVWWSKRVPTNLAALHPTFSQPSASQSRSSSAWENSSTAGRAAW